MNNDIVYRITILTQRIVSSHSKIVEMPAHDNITPYDKVDQSKKKQVTNMFDRIAPTYDFLNRFLSLGIDTIWRKNALRTLKNKDPKDILDIATGTADLAIEATRHLSPQKVVGMDISENMLNIGRKKVNKKNLDDRITLELGDSENLKYDTNSFDAVMSSFGVRNFENLKAGLSEMHRVCRSGGQCVVLEFSKPKIFPLKQLFNIYFKHILPVIGRIQSKDPKAYQYLYESTMAFPDYEKFADILKEVGFKNITWKPQTFGICTIYIAEK